MDVSTVMQELEALGKERTKKMYMSNGAREPLFGVTTGSMKPLFRQIRINQQLAEQLYATGNYDAMYFAGMIADPKAMTAEDFERWIEAAYFFMISDYIVAVTLAETDIAQQVSDKWIESGDELKMSAGWSCYCWLLGSRPDHEFSEGKLISMLDKVKESIHTAPERTKYAMSSFLYTVGVSYLPLHDMALQVSAEIGPVQVNSNGKKSTFLNAAERIQKIADKGGLGFKRKYVRC